MLKFLEKKEEEKPLGENEWVCDTCNTVNKIE